MTDQDRIELLQDALADMVLQFAYHLDNPPRITAGRLSVLEHAFNVLEWPDPKEVPRLKCQYRNCTKTATSGTPTKEGYKQVCGKHFDVLTRLP